MSFKTMTARFTSYLDADEGAVTVDFVALVSMIVLFGIAVAVTINTSTKDMSDRVAATIDTMDPTTF